MLSILYFLKYKNYNIDIYALYLDMSMGKNLIELNEFIIKLISFFWILHDFLNITVQISLTNLLSNYFLLFNLSKM